MSERYRIRTEQARRAVATTGQLVRFEARRVPRIGILQSQGGLRRDHLRTVMDARAQAEGHFLRPEQRVKPYATTWDNLAATAVRFARRLSRPYPFGWIVLISGLVAIAWLGWLYGLAFVEAFGGR